LIGLKRGKP